MENPTLRVLGIAAPILLALVVLGFVLWISLLARAVIAIILVLVWAVIWIAINWNAVQHAEPTRIRGDRRNNNSEGPRVHLEEDEDVLVHRDREERRKVASVHAAGMIVVPSCAGLFMGFETTIIAGICIGIMILAKNVRYILAYDPQLYALITEDPYRDEFVAYGAGWHERFWWELISRSSFVSLMPRLIRFFETYQAANGEVTLGIFLQFRVTLSNVLVFYRFGIDEVFKGITSTIRMFLTQTLISKTSKQVIEEDILGDFLHQNVAELKESIKTTLRNHAERTNISREAFERMSILEALEAIYGITFITFGIEDVEESAQVREARGAKAEVELIRDAALDLVGADSVAEARKRNESAWERAINTVTAISGKNAELSIWRIEGEDDSTGRTLAAAQGALGKRGGK